MDTTNWGSGASTNDIQRLVSKIVERGILSPDGYTHFGPINYCYCEIPRDNILQVD